jgi:hypothetical protein
VREQVLRAVAAEAGADAAIGSPHQSWHADRRGWRMASHEGSRLYRHGRSYDSGLCSYKVADIL